MVSILDNDRQRRNQIKKQTWQLVQEAARITGRTVEDVITLATGKLCEKACPGKIGQKVRTYALRVVLEKHRSKVKKRTKAIYRRSKRGYPYMGRVNVSS